jgi:molecular chaperone HtpG
LPEFNRRMRDMAATGGMNFMGMMPETYNVIINTNHKMIQRILDTTEDDSRAKLARQAYDLALLSQGMLKGAELTNFIQRSVEL